MVKIILRMKIFPKPVTQASQPVSLGGKIPSVIPLHTSLPVHHVIKMQKGQTNEDYKQLSEVFKLSAPIKTRLDMRQQLHGKGPRCFHKDPGSYAGVLWILETKRSNYKAFSLRKKLSGAKKVLLPAKC